MSSASIIIFRGAVQQVAAVALSVERRGQTLMNFTMEKRLT
jgi:hypothetical protein